ncbi:MAG: hypothetical protein Q9227_001482 [Pyrenula ochraceoflavens]
MDEYTADAFANRDEPLPLISVAPDDAASATSDQELERNGRRDKLRKKLSGSHLKEKIQQHADSYQEKAQGSPSLQDRLFIVVPLASLLLFVMVPAFLARHPPPPASASTSSTTPYSYYGPALAPAKTIKPASETSKDFFRNMRDLQNSMADFSALHDMSVRAIAPLTNFSNETLSSTFFLFSTVLTAALFIIAQLIPWRLIFLLSGYAVTCAGHPTVQVYLAKAKQRHQRELADSSSPDAGWIRFGPLPIPTSSSALSNLLYDVSSITLSTSPETREVEIFELQYRPLQPLGMSATQYAEWEPLVFTPTPYDPLSPSRISGDRPRGCRFFEDVQPPNGWSWKSKKWELDLEAREWIAERLVTGVEFEVGPEGEGMSDEFGGWVWDLPPLNKDDDNDDAYSIAGQSIDSRKKAKAKKEKENVKSRKLEKDWEEARGQGRTGEWRRRRWVRIVQREGAEDPPPRDRPGSSARGK